VIRLECQELERNPGELGTYLYCRAAVEDGGFTGWTRFVIAEQTWDEFSRQLAAYAQKPNSPVDLRAGWGDEVYFELELEPPDSRGHVWISGCVASPIRARVQVNPPVSHVLHFAYEIDMATLDRVVSDCSRFKADGAIIEVEGLPT
jgi:hypothetical protein